MQIYTWARSIAIGYNNNSVGGGEESHYRQNGMMTTRKVFEHFEQLALLSVYSSIAWRAREDDDKKQLKINEI